MILFGDCRFWRGSSFFDLILCLYDVIGSFRSENDNRLILENIFDNLRPGGCAVVSVMNLDFAGMSSAQSVGNQPDELYESLRRLKPSNNMADTGEVFDGKFALIDQEEGVVYRKEQFGGDDKRLRRELIVVERRFTMQSICKMCRGVGFNIVSAKYTRAGFRTPSFLNRLRASRCGKEILLVLRRPDATNVLRRPDATNVS